MSSDGMALRTRFLAAILRRTSTPVEEVDPQDFAGFRAERLKMQGSRLGGFIFGTVDDGVDVEERAVEHDGSQFRAIVYRPNAAGGTPLPGVLNFHGGGWVQGNPEQSQWLASRVAAQVPAVVVSVSYRLAPEHPFPAAVDDTQAALRWFHEHAGELGVDPSRISVMGDSAGGNLAAVTALLARDAGGPAVERQVLIYPAVEMYERWPSEDRNAEAPVLTSRNMRAFGRLYLAEQYGTEDVRASPIRATSLAGLPPAFILTAPLDPLLDNGTRYRDALQAAGVPVRYAEYRGAIHGFLSLPGFVPVAKQALADVVEYLQSDVR